MQTCPLRYKRTGAALDWFKNYLNGRSQQVIFNGCYSSNINHINSSVPQGSILGPLLFIYVNDFSNCLKYGTSLSFADDTSISISGKSAGSLYAKGNQELGNINDWLIANKLSLNASKTKCVYFRTASSKSTSSDLCLTIKNTPIERISLVRVLATIVHENLSWKSHMLMLKSTLRATLGAVMRVKPWLNKSTLLVIYHSLFASHVRYCIINWFFSNTIISSHLQNICNKLIRMTFNLSSKENVLPLMKEHGLLTIEDIFKHEVAVFMLEYHNHSLPAFDHIFQSITSSIITRRNSHLIPSFCRNTVSQQSIRYIGPKIWNSIPLPIRKSRSLSAFKRKPKQHLSSAY